MDGWMSGWLWWQGHLKQLPLTNISVLYFLLSSLGGSHVSNYVFYLTVRRPLNIVAWTHVMTEQVTLHTCDIHWPID